MIEEAEKYCTAHVLLVNAFKSRVFGKMVQRHHHRLQSGNYRYRDVQQIIDSTSSGKVHQLGMMS